MLKRLWKLIEKHEETEKQQNDMIVYQAKKIAKLRTTISNIEVITKLNRVGTGMADLYLNKINELVTKLENDN